MDHETALRLLRDAYDLLDRHQWDGATDDWTCCPDCGAAPRTAHRKNCGIGQLLTELRERLSREGE